MDDAPSTIPSLGPVGRDRTDRESHRESHRETERQRDIHTGTQIHRYTDTQTRRHTGTQAHSCRYARRTKL